MEQEREWAARVAAQIGAQVARLRAGDGGGRRMTAQALADRCAELGLPLDRAVIAKLEKGHRQSVTVAELLVLAKALGVPPVALVFPLGINDRTEVLPGRTMPTWLAVQWATGEEPFLGADTGAGWTVTPEDFDDWQNGPGAAVDLFRVHQRYVQDWQRARHRARDSRSEAADAPSGKREALVKAAEAEEWALKLLEDALRSNRTSIRSRGLTPPDLPEALGHVDDTGR